MELIKIALGDYPKYEELLLRKDKLEKESIQWLNEYIRVFGGYLIELFEVKVDCIRLKKMISMAQAAINQGLTPNMDEINELVADQMRNYYDDLQKMVRDHENSLKTKELPQHVILKIKKIYREIAKILHPDINPETEKDPVLKAKLTDKIPAAIHQFAVTDQPEIPLTVVFHKKRKGFDELIIILQLNKTTGCDEIVMFKRTALICLKGVWIIDNRCGKAEPIQNLLTVIFGENDVFVNVFKGKPAYFIEIVHSDPFGLEICFKG